MAVKLSDIKKWRRERKELAEQAGQLLRDAGDEALSAEAEERFEKIHGDIDELAGKIDRGERQHLIESELAESQGAKVGLRNWGSPEDDGEREESRGSGSERETREAWPENRNHEEEISFRHICSGATSLDLPGDDGQQFELRHAREVEGYGEMRRAVASELRSVNSASQVQGGYIIAPRYTGQLMKGMESFGGIRNSRARDWRTGHGGAIITATNHDTEMADVVGYGNQVAEDQPEYGQLVSNTLLANSRVVLVDLDVLEDATETANLQADLWDIAGRRIERRIQFEATLNDPAVSLRGNPGYLVDSPVGVNAALVGGVSFDELLDLKHSVNRYHRQRAEWGFSDGTELALKKMKNNDGDPAWSPGGVAFGAPRTFDGDPYFINDYAPGMGADAKSISYGDMSRLRLRTVRRIVLFRFGEKYMTAHQIGFMAFLRFGHLLENPGDDPIKVLQHPAA